MGAGNAILVSFTQSNRARSAAWGRYTENVKGGYVEVWGDRVQPGGFLSAARLALDAKRIESISGAFLEGGADQAGALEQALGAAYARSENIDRTFTQFRAKRSGGLLQAVALAVAVGVAIYTAGAATGAIASAAGEAAAATATAAGASEAAVAGASASAASAASWSTAAISGAAGAMAGNVGAQLITTGRLDAGQMLRSGLSGAISGGIEGYFGNSWTFDRVLANSVAGGISAQLQGGQFNDGFKSALLASSARYGWDYTRQATDAMKELAFSSGGDDLQFDERGVLRTDGARDTDWTLNPNEEGNWLTTSGMEREGSGLHWYDPGGPLDNKYPRYFVNDVSKMHDWFNSWNYNPANGFYLSRGEAFDSVFQLYSFVGMPVAGALTAVGYLSQTPFNQFLLLKPRKDSR